jgi:uncharacterized repeat protein (TIGR03803 family)
MKGLDSVYAVSISVAVALLAGCGGAQPPIGAPGAASQNVAPLPAGAAARRAAPVSFQILHRFGRQTKTSQNRDGANPDAGLVNVDGILYGTTELGGLKNSGVVYSITTTGSRKVLHRFRGSNGSEPTGDLTNVNGALYGTTLHGGSCSGGTVYSISTTGTEKVLHSFCPSGAVEPTSGVVNVGGTLYGNFTSSNGGGVYSINPSGVFKVVYAFGAHGDGFWPFGSLLNVNGTLYGVTTHGGAYCPTAGGCGTVFGITTSGKETVLYSFQGGSDGELPVSGLINVSGTLYGTTKSGGNSGCTFDYGCGTVYRITTSGTDENVLYRFTGGTDGGLPAASLVELNGTLYGTTSAGGADLVGTVFSVSASGGEQVLHNFSRSDGADPEADLLNVNGTLYGTDYAGGSKRGCDGEGCGTVFALTP